MNPRVKAWLEIVRLPNVLTAPGDPLAGLLLASIGAGSIPWKGGLLVCAASILLYMAGMILNDVMDIKEDTADRPGRPIPSGRISAVWAVNVCFLLSAAAIGLCFLVGQAAVVMGFVLLGLILAYDLGLKKVPIFGPLSMGLCRGVNLLLGVAVVVHQAQHLPLAPGAVLEAITKESVNVTFFLMTIYVAMVTMLARYETTERNPGILGWYPLGVLVLGFLALVWAITQEHGLSVSSVMFLFLSCLSMFLAYDAGRCIRVRKLVRPAMIGQFLAVLLLLQAALIFLADAGTPQPVWWIGALLLFLWPLNRGIRRFIAAS